MQTSALISAFVALTLFAASLPVYLDVGGVYSQLKVILEGERTVTETTSTVRDSTPSTVTFSCTSPNFAHWTDNTARTDVRNTTCPFSLTVDYPLASNGLDAHSVARIAWRGGSDTNGLAVFYRDPFGSTPDFHIIEVGTLAGGIGSRYTDWLSRPERAESTRSTGYNVAATLNYNTRTVTDRTEVVVDPYLSENPYAGILRALLPLLPVALLVWAFGSIGVVFLSGLGARRWKNSAKF